jgi:hypothetical protein
MVNGVSALSVIQILSLMCLVVYLGSINFLVHIGKSGVVLSALALFGLNYWWLVARAGGLVYTEQFDSLSTSRRIMIRLSVLAVFLMLSGALAFAAHQLPSHG